MTDSVRYGFGDNWSDYAAAVGSDQLSGADAGLSKLLPGDLRPEGKTFLDIGSGSGLHAVAASRMGFEVTATDYDENSVLTTRAVASRFGAKVDAFRDDILNTKLTHGYDVVYSWGVLHHTGDMKRAIANAASLVRPGGTFIIAIYLKTPLCGFWKVEKRVYSRLPKSLQSVVAHCFHAFAVAIGGAARQDKRERGMDWFHDARDWLGGYPYESASPETVSTLVGTDFELTRSFNTKAGRGILGSGCAEYVFRRR
ncbi:class I SAM-dependent methyltransferase [Devosia sp. LjRoot16]|uniref:class I SAM-dependent methyltransferase n=1 Tax=Devosia sp. LjRoot16 TaxID=3342271 RepID=UPI003ECEEF5E